MTSSPAALWKTTRFSLSLDRPLVMGIVNITPDSFSDGGCYAETRAAIEHCERQLEAGADILDLGAESSRPGAAALSDAEEQARLWPVLSEALKLGVPVSIDTYKADTMRKALDLGVDIINDIYAFRWPGALEAVAAHPSAGLCLMHMQGDPGTMQQGPVYDDVLEEVAVFLQGRVAALKSAGVTDDRLMLDPGIGFGKSVAHNLTLLARQKELLSLGYPLLLGWSRKSTLGALTGRAPPDRLAASVAAALTAAQFGARVLRVHDVAATVDAFKVGAAAGLFAGAH